MKTVTDFMEVHKMVPLGLPTFSIISDDKTVLAEIRDTDIDTYNMDEEMIVINTKRFFYLNNKEWPKNIDHNFTITLNQEFKTVDGDIVLLVKEYHQYYSDMYNSYGTGINNSVTYSYYFYSKKLHDRNKEEEH